MWRNSEINRKHSFNSNVISYKNHCEWLSLRINDPDTFLLIGELNKSAIGVLRYDISKSDATVSIYLVPGKHGQGIGNSLLEAGNYWLQKNVLTVKKAIAHVLSINIASEKAFNEAGFKKDSFTLTFNLPR